MSLLPRYCGSLLLPRPPHSGHSVSGHRNPDGTLVVSTMLNEIKVSSVLLFGPVLPCPPVVEHRGVDSWVSRMSYLSLPVWVEVSRRHPPRP